MKDNFARSLRAVLRDEGGNDNDPNDSGGRTSRGIIQREYNKFRAEHNLPFRDVWQADDDEIATIYHDNYWQPFCDGFPKGIDYLFFDTAVNTGTRQAALFLQRAAGVPDDGSIGPVTKAAVAKADAEALIRNVSDQKRHFYRHLVDIKPKNKKFLNGWLSRTDRVETIALAIGDLLDTRPDET